MVVPHLASHHQMRGYATGDLLNLKSDIFASLLSTIAIHYTYLITVQIK